MQPGGAQDVVGHALAPLPACLRAGQRGAQRLRRARQLGCRAQCVAQTLDQLAVLRARDRVATRSTSVAHSIQLVVHRREPLPDRIAMQRQLARAGLGAHTELIARDRHDGVDRGAHRRVSIGRALPHQVVTQSPNDDHDDQRRHCGHQHSHHQVPCHAAHHAEGV